MAARKTTGPRELIESMIKDMRVRHDEELGGAAELDRFEDIVEVETGRVAAGIYNDVAGRLECILAQMGQEGF